MLIEAGGMRCSAFLANNTVLVSTSGRCPVWRRNSRLDGAAFPIPLDSYAQMLARYAEMYGEKEWVKGSRRPYRRRRKT